MKLKLAYVTLSHNYTELFVTVQFCRQQLRNDSFQTEQQDNYCVPLRQRAVGWTRERVMTDQSISPSRDAETATD